MVEDLPSEAQTSRADGLIILFRFNVAINSSPIHKIEKTEQLCGLGLESLKLQFVRLGFDDVERNKRSLTGSGAGLPHSIPGLLAA